MENIKSVFTLRSERYALCLKTLLDAKQMPVSAGEMNRIVDIRVAGPDNAANSLVLKRCASALLMCPQRKRCRKVNSFVSGLAERVQCRGALPEALVVALLEAHVGIICQGTEISGTDKQ